MRWGPRASLPPSQGSAARLGPPGWPAVFQDRQWWFDPDRIEMIRRARHDRVFARTLRRPGGPPQ
ncbi:hypothetical protein [Kribbella sp. NBC_00889]|uniref:hypothetical protein n=1 Tax=Kribbella sp. NBC_00889 TaxID=2975974 RepID=UPI00386AF584|nr:hypothetical protein OG817_31505 [Kribbella sp. NBC_00889]